jgi:hypothetical protein
MLVKRGSLVNYVEVSSVILGLCLPAEALFPVVAHVTAVHKRRLILA